MPLAGKLVLGSLLTCASATVSTAQVAAFDPVSVDIANVIGCRISGSDYLGFTMAVSDDEDPGSAKARGWKKLPTASSFYSSYRLSKPVAVFGYTTDTVAFTGSGMFAVLDLADPAELGKQQGIANILEGTQRFKGERVVDESIEIDKETGYRFKNRSVLQIGTVPAFPGKTLIGCSYDGELKPPGS